MRTIVDLLRARHEPGAKRAAARRAFLAARHSLWEKIQNGNYPARYTSSDGRRFTGAPLRTAIRCDFLLANQLALGMKYRKDRISDLAQRDLLFSVLRNRERFGQRTGGKFYCCPTCTGKLYECVSAGVFRYIDNARWKAGIEARRSP